MKKSVQMKTMTKRMYWWYCMVLALTLLPASMKAQNPIEFVDTIDVEEVTDYSLSVTQYELKDFDWIDVCKNPKYAIVTRDGKKGIYDVQVGRNITEIEFQELGYSRQNETVDSSEVYMFYAKKGIKCGILGVCASNNGVFSLFMDDLDEIYSLEECTTIDEEMSELAWLSAETTWLGYATTDDIFDEKDKFRKSPIGRQIQFAGLFPADAPRYTICIVAEKYSPEVTPDQFQHVVNPLASWLLRRN